MLLKVFGKATGEERQGGPSSQGQSPPPPAACQLRARSPWTTHSSSFSPDFWGLSQSWPERTPSRLGTFSATFLSQVLRPATRDLQPPRSWWTEEGAAQPGSQAMEAPHWSQGMHRSGEGVANTVTQGSTRCCGTSRGRRCRQWQLQEREKLPVHSPHTQHSQDAQTSLKLQSTIAHDRSKLSKTASSKVNFKIR